MMRGSFRRCLGVSDVQVCFPAMTIWWIERPDKTQKGWPKRSTCCAGLRVLAPRGFPSLEDALEEFDEERRSLERVFFGSSFRKP